MHNITLFSVHIKHPFLYLYSLAIKIRCSAKMNWWTPVLLLSLTCVAVAQISCTSPLRFRFPHLFSHCQCGVGPWAGWAFKSEKNCTTHACQMGCNESGYANLLERKREAIPPSCDPSEPLNETQEVCESAALLLYDLSSISLANIRTVCQCMGFHNTIQLGPITFVRFTQ